METYAEDAGYNPADYIRPISRSEAEASWSRTQDVVRRALLNGGAVIQPGEVEWDCAGRCEKPHLVFQHEIAGDLWRKMRHDLAARVAADAILAKVKDAGLGDAEAVVRRKRNSDFLNALKVSVWVRCRRCKPCRTYEARKWQARGIVEIDAAVRTWFGTLTLSPQAQEHYRNVARLNCLRRGTDWDALGPGGQFGKVVQAIYPEVQLWLKRVRKSTKAGMRYVIVAEPHESGAPHFHLLVHQCTSVAIRERDLTSKWRIGRITQFRLVNDRRGVFYVTKYITKDAAARVRASASYGSPSRNDGKPLLAIDTPASLPLSSARLEAAPMTPLESGA